MAPPLAVVGPAIAVPRFRTALPCGLRPRKLPSWRRAALPNDEDYYLIDAEESIGDGFSFSGGKYGEGPSKSDEWFAQGKMVNAYPVYGDKGKAKDPFFGLTMGSGSQPSDEVFRWFCVESGSPSNPKVLLIHGLPSQAYSYRNVLPVLSDKYHALAFDWLGWWDCFSDECWSISRGPQANPLAQDPMGGVCCPPPGPYCLLKFVVPPRISIRCCY